MWLLDKRSYSWPSHPSCVISILLLVWRVCGKQLCCLSLTFLAFVLSYYLRCSKHKVAVQLLFFLALYWMVFMFLCVTLQEGSTLWYTDLVYQQGDCFSPSQGKPWYGWMAWEQTIAQLWCCVSLGIWDIKAGGSLGVLRIHCSSCSGRNVIWSRQIGCVSLPVRSPV